MLVSYGRVALVIIGSFTYTREQIYGKVINGDSKYNGDGYLGQRTLYKNLSQFAGSAVLLGVLASLLSGLSVATLLTESASYGLLFLILSAMLFLHTN